MLASSISILYCTIIYSLQQQLDFLIPHKGDAQEELLPGPPIEDTSAYKVIDTHMGIHAYKLTETPIAPSKSMLRHNATRSKPLSVNTPTSTGFSADHCDVLFKHLPHQIKLMSKKVERRTLDGTQPRQRTATYKGTIKSSCKYQHITKVHLTSIQMLLLPRIMRQDI